MAVHDIVGKEQLDALLSQDGLVFVDFWAEWCGPCRMLGPVLHEIAEKHPTVHVAKVNVDEEANGPLAMDFAVRSIPQVTIFKNGQQVDQFVGALPLEQIESYIEKYSG